MLYGRVSINIDEGTMHIETNTVHSIRLGTLIVMVNVDPSQLGLVVEEEVIEDFRLSLLSVLL